MKISRSNSRRRGTFLLEFTLTGVPMILVLVSLFSLSMGMWQYHTLAEAVQATTRNASAHGANCVSKTCATTVSSVASQIASRAVGIPASRLNVTLNSSGTPPYPCNPLPTCYTNNSAFPSVSANSTTLSATVTISATYQFTPAISFWSPKGKIIFNPIVLGAHSSQPIVN